MKAAIIAIMLAFWIAIISSTLRPLPPPVPAPAVPPRPVFHPVSLTQRDGSYARWRAETPVRFVSQETFRAALLAAGWPADDAERMTVAAATCEAAARDYVWTADGWQGWRYTGEIDLMARGDEGRAFGVGIRPDYHPGIAERWDLDTLDGQVGALTEIRNASLALGRPPLEPWHCVR